MALTTTQKKDYQQLHIAMVKLLTEQGPEAALAQTYMNEHISNMDPTVLEAEYDTLLDGQIEAQETQRDQVATSFDESLEVLNEKKRRPPTHFPSG